MILCKQLEVKSSSATNRSKLDMHQCYWLLTRSSVFHKQCITGTLGPSRVLRILLCLFPPYFHLIKIFLKASRHKLCLIFSKLGTDDLQTMTHKCIQHLLQNQRCLAVTGNQTWRWGRQTQSFSAHLYVNQTWYTDSWHHPGDTQNEYNVYNPCTK
jgi:hypothetical protein